MRKIFVLSLLLLTGLFLAREAFADAPQARTADETNYVVGISHITNGRTLIIDAEGRAYVRDMGGHTISTDWGDRLVYTGECVVHAVILHAESADDYAEVYDATSATGTAKADPQHSTAKNMVEADLKGSLFSTGIYINASGGEDSTHSTALVTVIYDAL